jgi:tRNA pseudouridine55 synthase
MNGILLVDKPYGWTSFDVVNYVRKVIAVAEDKKPKHVKVGHTGTLDPLATGLLVLLIGSYTRRASEFVKLDKTYEATMKLGEVSTTGDAEGEKTIVSDKQPTQAEIVGALEKFTGDIMQTPPAFSALKVGGQRAYALARQGRAVKLEPRAVKVYKSKLISYEYPIVKFTCEVSSGTYIRSLVEDLGQTLTTGAYLTDLCRSQIGPFNIGEALKPEGLNPEVIQAHLNKID